MKDGQLTADISGSVTFILARWPSSMSFATFGIVPFAARSWSSGYGTPSRPITSVFCFLRPKSAMCPPSGISVPRLSAAVGYLRAQTRGAASRA